MKRYEANDIQTLDFRNAIRKRIEMYMGSADNQAVIQCIREIISNCIDESIMGYGKNITVEYLGNNRLRVSDEGRGCPFGVREDGTEALEAIYLMAHSGGKFDDKVYRSVIGANGIGAKGVALSSEEFIVTTYRDSKMATLKVKEGVKESFEVKPLDQKRTGTTVEWVSSQEVYRLEPIHVDFEIIHQMCKNWSYLHKGIKFILTNHENNETTTYVSKNGLVDLIRDYARDPIHTSPIQILIKDNEKEIELELALQWTKGREHSFVYTNGLENVEGGTPLTGVKMAITRALKKKIPDLNGDLARTGLVYAISVRIPNPSFANQTKTKVNNPELNALGQRAATELLVNFGKDFSEFGKVLDFLGTERKAEEAAQKARRQVLEASKDIEKNIKRKVFASDKLKDAEHLGEKATLLIVEGKSAGGSMALARDSSKYGILQVMGKMINPLTNSEEKVFNNEEIKLLFSALGIIPGKYNSSKLRYGRVAICVDGDSDGDHIALLIMTIFQTLIPEFFNEGRLYWLKAPLYIVKGKTNQYYFSDHEFNAAKEKSAIKGKISRAKGLGSMDAKQAKESMFGANQHLENLIPNKESYEVILDLMGKDATPRKEFLIKHLDFTEVHE